MLRSKKIILFLNVVIILLSCTGALIVTFERFQLIVGGIQIQLVLIILNFLLICIAIIYYYLFRGLYYNSDQKKQDLIKEVLNKKSELVYESTEQIRAMYNTLSDGITFADLNGNITELNNTVLQMHGYVSKEELIGHSAMELVAEEDRSRALSSLATTLETGKSNIIEYKFIKKNGDLFDAELNSVLLKNSKGEPYGFVALTRDITERKRAEEALQQSEDKFRSIVEKALIGIFIIDDNHRYLYVNDELCRICGYSSEELIGTDSRIYLPPESAKFVTDRNARRLAGEKEPNHYEINTMRRDGEIRRVDIIVTSIIDSGGKVRTIGQMIDITERKQAEEALKQSEDKFRSIVENALAGIFILDENFHYIYVNDELCKIHNCSNEELIGADTRKYLTSESWDLVNDKVRRRIAGEKLPTHYELKILRSNGEIRQVEIIIAYLKDASGKPRLIGQVIDITERKRSEEALRRNEEQFRGIAQNIPGMVYQFYARKDGQTGFNYISDNSMEYFGLDNKPLEGFLDRFQSGLQEGERAQFLSSIKTAIESASKWEFEGKYTRPNGEVMFFHALSQPRIVDTDLIFDGIVFDITEHKLAVQALAVSEEKYRQIVNTANEGIWSLDANSNTTFVNARMTEMLGYKEDDLLGKRFTDFLFPEDISDHERRIALRSRGINERYERRMCRKDGSILWVLISGTPLYDSQKRFCGAFGMFVDITESKQGEEALRKSEAKLSSIFRVAPTGIGMVINRVIMEVNDRICEMTGYSKNELIGKSARILYPSEEDFEYVGREKYRQINEYGIGTVETRWKCKNGKIIDILLSSAPINPQDYLLGVTFTALDITERKHTEESVRESEVKFRFLAENVSDVLWVMDAVSGKWLYMSPSVERLRGFTVEEVLQQSLDEAMTLESFNNIRSVSPERIASFLKNPDNDHVYRDEIEQTCKNGSTIWTEVETRFIMNGKGEVNLIGISRDITRRKQAEEALKESEERFRRIFEEGQIGITLASPDYKFINANPAFCRMIGYTVEELKKLTFKEITAPDQIEVSSTNVIAISRGELKQYRTEKQYLRKDGKLFWGSLATSAIRDTQGNILVYLAMVEDITDRKKAEEEVRKLNEELESRVQQRTSQLETANKELESFAYSVSHDLRAPLRAIDGFGLALQEDYQNLFDERGKNYIDRIRSNSQKMSNLIDNLLNMSRVVRKEIDKKEVDLSKIAQETYNELTEFIGDREIEFRLTSQMIDIVDPQLIKLCFQNLLDNALKFTKGKEKTFIEIGYKFQNDKKVYFVKDNGVGFKEEYSSKLFGVFQRLHTQDEFPGTGVGLATVQRIIHKHDGKIWAESKLNKGATFYFTLNE